MSNVSQNIFKNPLTESINLTYKTFNESTLFLHHNPLAIKV